MSSSSFGKEDSGRLTLIPNPITTQVSVESLLNDSHKIPPTLRSLIKISLGHLRLMWIFVLSSMATAIAVPAIKGIHPMAWN